MDYRIITTAPGSSVETIRRAPGMTPWTHETATAWAHVEGRKLPVGSRIAIDRRRGMAMYLVHRRYMVDADGIVRRTDRTTQSRCRCTEPMPEGPGVDVPCRTCGRPVA